MAKIREKQPDADAGRLIVDEQLENLEARLTAIYGQTANEIQADLDKFLSKYENEDAKKSAMVEAGELSKEDYIDWRERQIFRTNTMKAKIDDVTTRIVHADEQAMSMVSNQLPETYATSYNFGGYRAETQSHSAGFDYTQFTIINQDAVRVLAKEDPDLIPWKPDVDVEEDKRWNRQHVQNAIFQGITKGDSMPDVAKRLLPVVNMDKNAAIRTARTAVNGIENKGRKDATERVKEAGIPMVEVWSATHDQRTRDTHILLDGTEPDDRGLFGKGIISKLLAYPGDPSGDPEEVYNCRCGLSSTIKGIDHSKDDELYAKMMEEEFFDDWVKVKEERQEKEEAFQKNKEGAAERVAAKQSSQEEKSKEDKLQDLGVKTITADDIDLDRLNFTDGRFGKYAYELGEEMQENSDDNLILELTTKGKYQDHIAYASIDEESASLEGIVSDGGGAGTELLGKVMEYQESKGEGLIWMADNPESIKYYEHLGLDKWGEGSSRVMTYDVPAEDLKEALELVNEHRDIVESQPEELPKAIELLSAEDRQEEKTITAIHITKDKNIKSIINNGFDLSRAGQGAGTVWGDGVYFSTEELEQRFYSIKTESKNAVEADIDTSNMITIDLGKGAVKSPDAMYKKAAEQLPDELQAEFKKEYRAAKKEGSYAPRKDAFEKVAKDNYSGVIIKQEMPEGLDPLSGGNQIVVFDTSVINIRGKTKVDGWQERKDEELKAKEEEHGNRKRRKNRK